MVTLPAPQVRRAQKRRRSLPLAIAAALTLVIGFFLPVTPPSASASSPVYQPTTTLSSTETTWTTSRSPSKVHGDLPYLSATSSQDSAFIKFNGAALKGKKVVSARLQLRIATTSATKPGFLVYKAPTSWSESTLTHNSKPADNKTRVNATAPQAAAAQTISVPISDLSAISTTGSFAFRVQYLQDAVGTTFVATGASAPKLVLNYESTPVDDTSDVKVEPPTVTNADKKIFAVYFPPYPLSIDNKVSTDDYYARNYLPVNGEGGIHAEYGGLLRDRPLPVAPSSSSSWRVDNLRTEIRQAKTAGIDAFLANILGVQGMNWTAILDLYKAGELENFPIVPMVDGTAAISRLTPSQAAAALAPLFKSSASYKEGKDFLLSSFKAEGPGAAWFKQVIDLLETKYQIPVTFQASFLNASDANMKAFAPFSDSFGNWGERNPRVINKLPDYDAKAQALGKDWMESVAPQDMRPRLKAYAEAGNTEALRAGWAKAIRDDAEYVQMVTWNDYSESTQFAPSAAHGSAFLQINRYYADWFHTGTAPRITTDQLFVSHREHFANAKTAIQHARIVPSLSGSEPDVRDTVEALVFLTAPATVQITVGGTTTNFSAPAGVSAYKVPLKVGSVSAKVIRSGAAVKTAVSPFKVVSTPSVQDLQYYIVTGK